MTKPVIASIIVYLIMDSVSDFILEPIGLDYLHAFIAMFCGMFVGGLVAGKNFVPAALIINLCFSMLTYMLVAQMREQSVISLIGEQHLMVSVGSFAGAALGAWLGRQLAQLRRSDSTGD